MPRSFDSDLSLQTLRRAMLDQGKQLGDTDVRSPASHCLPLYFLNGADAVGTQPLRRARLSAVLFPIVEDGHPAIAAIDLQPEKYAYTGIAYGPIPNLIHQALNFAQERVGSRRQSYRPLILQSLSLQLMLLVLRPKSGRTLFTPLLHQTPATPERFRLCSGLPAYLVAAHTQRYT